MSMPRRDAVSRSITSVVCKPAVLLVARDVASVRAAICSLVTKRGRPSSEFVGIDVFQRVLKLRAADAIFDREILHGLHVKGDAVDSWRVSAADGE